MKYAIAPHWNQSLKPFRHSWEGLVNVDQFRFLIRRDMQDQLARTARELGAKHVRAVGIFDDELKVFWRQPNHPRENPVFNWQVVDYAIDSLLDIGINPVFTTTFVPSRLASGTNSVFSVKSNTSLPNDFTKWSELVSETFKHFIWRYGRDRVREWYCEVWNEPNLRDFFGGSKEDFYHLWTTTYKAFKDVDPAIRVGGPSTARAEWIEDFIKFGRKNGCEPDFIIGHIYNNDSESKPLSPFAGLQEDKQSNSPHFADAVIRGSRELLDSLNYKGELQWNEWGRSWLPAEPKRETSNEAAYVAKSMAEIAQCVTHLAPWALSDIYDQVGYGAETFHGNYGLLNLQGLRKPAYIAYQLLSRLATQRYQTDEVIGSKVTGGIVTPGPNGNGTSVLVYDYDHSCKETGEVDFTVALPEGYTGKVRRTIRIDNAENNILTTWKNMGSPAYLTREETASMLAGNGLNESATPAKLSGNQLTLSIQRGSVALVELS